MSNEQSKLTWYKEGLKFKCTGCGKCCTGQPGYVWVTRKEIEKMAAHLNLTQSVFMQKYVRNKYGRYSLIEKKSANYDCIFLHENKCQIYDVRPVQCRTFPWWVNNLTSKESWKEAASYCEGITEEAPIVPFEEIEKQLELKKASDGQT